MIGFINDIKLDISIIKRVLIGLFVFMVLFLFILLVRKTFAAVTPVNNVKFVSEKATFDKGVGGAFKVTESVKWLTKNEAEVNFKVNSNVYENGKSKDIVLVINDSNFVNRNSYNKLKDGLKSNIKNLLSNDNRLSIITYNASATITNKYSDNYDELVNSINRLSVHRGTNYYDALCKVDTLLRNRDGDRELVVLMIMNSYPTLNSPMEVSEYAYLKENYKDINIIGIQYDLGKNVIDKIDKITDNSYVASSNNISKVINNTTKLPVTYEKFDINEYIDDEYFEISSDIDSTLGKVSIDKSRINWNLDNSLISGFDASMRFKIKLNKKYSDVDGVFNVSKNIVINSKIEDLKEKISSKNTPIVKNNYDVLYEPNAPKGCVLKDIPDAKSYSIFDVVKKENTELECEGYQFKGWEIVNDVKKINDDYFVMGEENVVIRGTWSKIKINLSMEGSIHQSLGIFDLLKSNEAKDSYSNGIHSLSNAKNPIYYYKGNSNNNLIFAGYCWKIVRSTTSNGVKIIYNGVQKNNKCVNTFNDGLMNTYYFSKYSTSLSDLGYMYGERTNIGKVENEKYKFSKNIKYVNGVYELVDSTDDITNKTKYSCLNDKDSCDSVYYITSFDDNNIYYLKLNGESNVNELLSKTFANENDSFIKYYIDNWYVNNLYKYRNYLEDTVYCNDRRLDEEFEFETYNRVRTKNLTLECSKNDSFSVSSRIGNGDLKYPIGMLSIDEYVLSSGSIDNGKKFYLMSPYEYNGNSYVFKGNDKELVSDSSTYVRPVISLKGNVKIVDGMGTKENPYIIKLI